MAAGGRGRPPSAEARAQAASQLERLQSVRSARNLETAAHGCYVVARGIVEQPVLGNQVALNDNASLDRVVAKLEASKGGGGGGVMDEMD